MSTKFLELFLPCVNTHIELFHVCYSLYSQIHQIKVVKKHNDSLTVTWFLLLFILYVCGIGLPVCRNLTLYACLSYYIEQSEIIGKHCIFSRPISGHTNARIQREASNTLTFEDRQAKDCSGLL